MNKRDFVKDNLKKYTGLELDQLVVLSVAGSHMYGTATPDSDEDYLGVYTPTKRQLLLNDFPRQISFPKDSGVDLQIWSIHYFLHLATHGETLSIDLLHAPFECLIKYDPEIWGYLKRNRRTFFTKNMTAFVSYARKQAAKYGIKGERITDLETVIQFIKPFAIDTYEWKLKELWEKLPDGTHIHKLEHTRPYRFYQVCGKKFQETVKATYILEHLEKHLTEFGKRAMLAKENKGVDWKAVSHAIRAADQVYDILRFGYFEFPLRTAAFIKNVKLGKLNFVDVVQPYLEDAMNDVEKLIEESDLPEKCDKKFWNDWLVYLMENYIL